MGILSRMLSCLSPLRDLRRELTELRDQVDYLAREYNNVNLKQNHVASDQRQLWRAITTLQDKVNRHGRYKRWN